MAVFFLDTSAAVKRYIHETGTSWIRMIAEPSNNHSLYIARITDVEVTAALARRRQGSINPQSMNAALAQFRKDFSQDYTVMEITISLLQHAASLADTHALRGYDAVQLAAALEVSTDDPSLTLISADDDLNKAAAAAGLAVENPNDH